MPYRYTQHLPQISHNESGAVQMVSLIRYGRNACIVR